MELKKLLKCFFVSSVTPYMLKPMITLKVFQRKFLVWLKNSEDRPAFLAAFGKTFYGVSMINQSVSKPMDQMLMLK
jgi:hypothetical protein